MLTAISNICIKPIKRHCLQDIEKREATDDGTLADVLAFCTGYDTVPLNGWLVTPQIKFDHEKLDYEKGYEYSEF